LATFAQAFTLIRSSKTRYLLGALIFQKDVDILAFFGLQLLWSLEKHWAIFSSNILVTLLVTSAA
jgi:hypothetical protein